MKIFIYFFMPALLLATGVISGIAYERYWRKEECLETAFKNTGESNLSEAEIEDILKTLNSSDEKGAPDIEQASPEIKQNYVGSKNGNKFYPVDCRYAKLIKEENKVYFASREEGENQGRTYAECK